MNTKIAETIRSDSGFYFGDVKMIGCFATKKKAHYVALSGGGKVTDKKTGLDLVGSQPISTMTGGRVIFGCGDAQLEADGDLVKITLPSAEVVKLHTRRTA